MDAVGMSVEQYGPSVVEQSSKNGQNHQHKTYD